MFDNIEMRIAEIMCLIVSGYCSVQNFQNTAINIERRISFFSLIMKSGLLIRLILKQTLIIFTKTWHKILV